MKLPWGNPTWAMGNGGKEGTECCNEGASQSGTGDKSQQCQQKSPSPASSKSGARIRPQKFQVALKAVPGVCALSGWKQEGYEH